MRFRYRTRGDRLLVVGVAVVALLVLFGVGPASASAHIRSQRSDRLTTSAREQIATAFRAIRGNVPDALGHRYLQGYDGAIAVALDNAAARWVGGFAGPVTTAESISQIRLVSHTVATGRLTFSVSRLGTVETSQAFLVTAVNINGRWMVSWASQCAVVQAADQPRVRGGTRLRPQRRWAGRPECSCGDRRREPAYRRHRP